MKALDILLLVGLAWGAYSGFKKGLILEVFSSSALILATAGSVQLLDDAIGLCTKWYDGQQTLLPFVLFLCLFVVIFIITTWVGRLLKVLIKTTVMGGLDRLLGGVLGMLKWGMYGSICMWLGSLLQLKIPEAYTENSFLFPIIQSLAPQLLTWCFTWLPQIQRWFLHGESVGV